MEGGAKEQAATRKRWANAPSTALDWTEPELDPRKREVGQAPFIRESPGSGQGGKAWTGLPSGMGIAVQGRKPGEQAAISSPGGASPRVGQHRGK